MKYSVANSSDLCSWSDAAKNGGSVPEKPVAGEPRFYNVDAWLVVEGFEPVNVRGIWFSRLPEELRKPLLKELGLPVKKTLVYKDAKGAVFTVSDVRIMDVWDGWCTVAVRLEDGTEPVDHIHSMYFAEMNSGTSAHDGVAKKREKKSQTVSRKKSIVSGMPLDFVVFDLETTGFNCKVDEICEIAALRIIDGEIADQFERLVYIDGDMPAAAERVNHISKDMLEEAPHMTGALSSFLSFVGPSPVLVGHNIKTFDIPLIERVAASCSLDFSYKEAIDTLQLAKRAWPNLSSYKMDDLRDRLDFDIAGSHRALKDCVDEFELYMRIRHDVANGKASIKPPKRGRQVTGAAWSEKWNRKKAKEFLPTVSVFDESDPLYGKHVVLSGDIEGYAYNEVMQFICDCGGTPQDNVTRKTDYVVVGSGAGGSKVAKARLNQEKGLPTEILDEESFKRLVGWE